MPFPLWVFDSRIQRLLENTVKYKSIQEIRMRANGFISITADDGKYFLSSDGSLTAFPVRTSIKCDRVCIQDTLMRACDGSIYAKQSQINNGFVTVKGGHRIGLCGRAVYENGGIYNITDLNGLNIRFARQINGASKILYEMYNNNGIYNTLIVGAVGSGKTTVLRDIVQKLANADGMRLNVSVIDEREEIGGSGNFKLGEFADLLNGYRKPDGIKTAIRTLSPDVVAFDEFATREEFESVIDCFNCGVTVITTCHAKDKTELMRKPYAKQLTESGMFKYFVYLKDKHIERIEENESYFPARTVFHTVGGGDNDVGVREQSAQTT